MNKIRLFLVFIFIMLTINGCKKEAKKINLMESFDNIQGLENLDSSSELVTSFRNKIFYEVNKIEWNGDFGIAVVSITTPDLNYIIRDTIRNVLESSDKSDYNSLLSKIKYDIQKKIESNNCPMIEKAIEMETIKQDDNYSLISNDAFEKIIEGNLEEIFLQVITMEK